MDQNLKHIIKQCGKNNRKAQEELYRMFFPTMINMILRHTKDRGEAQLILNNGFLKVFKKINSFKSQGSFEGWVRKIIYHSISDYFRSKSRYVKFLVFEDHDLPINNLDDNLHEEDILKMIDSIPESSANVFTLYCIEGYSHKEIASLKNISIGTSKWHLANARKKLQELILTARSNTSKYVNG